MHEYKGSLFCAAFQAKQYIFKPLSSKSWKVFLKVHLKESKTKYQKQIAFEYLLYYTKSQEQ